MRYLAGVTSMTLTITLVVLLPSTPTLLMEGVVSPRILILILILIPRTTSIPVAHGPTRSMVTSDAPFISSSAGVRFVP